MDNQVIRVNRPDGRPTACDIMWGNIVLTFAIVKGKIRVIGRSSPSAQVYDPHNLEVPDRAFHDMFRRACAILREGKN